MAKQVAIELPFPEKGAPVELKFKFRDPNNIPVRKNGSYKQRTNPAKKGTSGQGTGHRRRSYFTHIH